MIVTVDGFRWDDSNRAHCGKHGVTREEIEHVLSRMTFYVPDPYPDEPRMRTVGLNKTNRHIFVVFSFREIGDAWYIRATSARYMHAKEVKAYERFKNT